MIEYVNQIADLIIKISIIIGIALLICFYVRLRSIDLKIEQENNKFEKERDGKRGQGRGIPEEIISGQINALQKNKEELIAPLERERQRIRRIISKIPFLK